jgi:hypothetical protein
MLAGGGLLVGLLVTAALLEPSAAGMGTHRQLGLPPCTMVVLVGIRCPACGMTTSWARMVRGNVVGSARANSGGAMLALAALAGGPWLLASGLAGRWVWGLPRENIVLGIGLAIVAVTLVDWCLRLSGRL